MKKRFMWKRVIALVLAVLMLPISDFAECFSITAYAATSELVSESQETYAAEADENLEVPDENDGEVHTQDNDPGEEAESIETSAEMLRGSDAGAQTENKEMAINLRAELDDAGVVQLNWTLDQGEQTVFVIYKNDRVLETVSFEKEQDFSFSDADIIASATYDYRVETSNEEDEDLQAIIYESNEACVKIPNALNIENDYVRLDEDTVVLDLNMINGSLEIKEGHKLVVLRNASIRDSSVSLAGMLCCNGNMSSYDSNLYMYYDEESFLYGGGDTLWKNGTVYFEDGSARFDGNFVMENCCYGYDGFRVIFGGDSRQDIDISLNSDYAEFPVIESQNTSSEGIHFSKGFNCRGMELGDNIAYFGETKAVGDWILTEDTEYEGDLYLIGTIDLNGHSLTVNGDLLQPTGKIMINGGKLNIQGDYRIENTLAEEPQYTVSNGTLDMENELDEIIVNGDLAVCNEYCLYISNGKMEVKGDILLASYYYDEGYFTKGNCALDFGGRLILSGEEKQEFRSENEAYMSVAELFLTNSSEDGISMHDYCIEVSEYIEDQSRHVEGILRLGNTVSGNFKGNAGTAWGFNVSDELIIGGDLMIYGGLNSLNITGCVTNGSLNITGSLEVQGNLTMDSYSSLSMTEEAYLLVHGDFYVKEHAEVKLDAGTVECKGNLISEGGLEATGTNRFLFSGEEKQLISTVYPDRFAVIELKNTSDDGVLAESAFDYIQLIRNDSKFEFAQEALESNIRLNEDTLHEGDLILTGGFMNLNGHELHVTGNVIHESGVIDLNNGRLIVDGDYKMQKNGSADEDLTGSGVLKMSKAGDYLLVAGDFIVDSDAYFMYADSQFTDGTVEVKGDVTIRGDGDYQAFMPERNSVLLLSGDGMQQINVENSGEYGNSLNHLTIANGSEAGVVFADKICVRGSVEDKSRHLAGDLVLGTTAKLIGSYFGGNLWINNADTIRDLEVAGDLHLGESWSSYDIRLGNCNVSGDFYSNVWLELCGTLNVEGNCYIESRCISLNEGTLNVGGDFILPDRNGYLKMTHEKDRICVRGNASLDPSEKYRTYDPDYLSSGTMEIKGDLTYGKGFISTNDFRLVFNGEKKQTIRSTYQQYVNFATIIVNNQSSEGVVFDIANADYLRYRRLSNQNSRLIIAGKEYEADCTMLGNFSLRTDEFFEGNVYVQGSLSLNDCKMTISGNLYTESAVNIYSAELSVKGDLIQSKGTLNVGGASKVTVDGDYRIQSRTQDENGWHYGSSEGVLSIDGEESTVLVKGSFISATTRYQYTYYGFRGGLLEVQGDFIIDDTYAMRTFGPELTYSVKLSGSQKQCVDLGEEGTNNNYFKRLILTNDSEEGIVFRRTAYVTEQITDEARKITGGIYVTDENVLSEGSFGGQVMISGSISKPLTLAGDLIVAEGTSLRIIGNVRVNGNVSAKAKVEVVYPGGLSVGGDAVFEDRGSLYIDSAQMSVDGNLRMDGAGSTGFGMAGSTGKLLVKGNAYFRSAGNIYTPGSGEMEILGDFTAVSGWKTGGSFKTVFSGEKKQKITLGAGQSFKTVEFKNFSEEGIELSNVTVDTLVIQWGSRLTGDQMAGQYEIRNVLCEDRIIEGDYLMEESMDLNGHTLTVKGNLIHRFGDLLINGGHLIVEGDYLVMDTSDALLYPNSSSYSLKMNGADDRVLVKGNVLIDETDKAFTWNFTDGVFEVQGDIALDRTRTMLAAKAGNQSTLILSGEELQSVTSREKNCFGNIVINNSSEEGVCFGQNILLYGKFTSNHNHVSGTLGIASGDVSFSDNGFDGSIILYTRFPVKNDFSISGDLQTNGYDLAAEEGILNVGGDLKVDNKGGIDIQTATVIVSGNLSIEGAFRMTKADSGLHVRGNVFAAPKTSGLTNGLFVVEGDFEAKNTFRATDNHLTEFAGDHKQNVTMQSGTCLRNVRLNNISPEGVYFNSIFVSGTMDFGNSAYTMGETAGILGHMLTEDETYEGDMVLCGGVLDLNGHTLTVDGNLIHTAGVIRVNGGMLKVNGNYSQSTEEGILEMSKPADRVAVDGAFSYTYVNDRNNSLACGTLEVKGNCTLGRSYSGKLELPEMTLVFSGDGYQSFNINGAVVIKNIVNRNAENLQISANGGNGISVTGVLRDEIKKNNISGTKIRISSEDQIADGIWGGAVEFGNSVHLTKALRLRGLVQSVAGVTVSLGETRLDVQSVSVSNGALELQKGTIACTGIFQLSNGGRLHMQDDEGKIIAGGGFESKTSGSGLLTAGTIEVYGNFLAYGKGAFIASGAHTVRFPAPKDPDAPRQSINLADSTGTSKFGTIILERAAEDYVFSKSLDEMAENVRFELRDVRPPESITDLVAEDVSATYITIRFREAVDENGIGGYRIERNGEIIATINNTEFKDSGLTPDTEYTYRVFPFDKNFNNCEESPVLQVKTTKDLNAPTVPVLSVDYRTGTSITLAWKKSSDDVGVAGYNLYRNNVLIAEGLTSTTYKDRNLSIHTIYGYQVEAFDLAGNVSPKSSILETSVLIPAITEILPKQASRIGGDRANIIVHYNASSARSSDRVKIEYLSEADEWKQLIDTIGRCGNNLGNGLYQYSAEYSWNLSGLAGNRDYRVRITLTDEDGNYATELRTYHLDRQAPKAPVGVDAIAKDGTVILEWEPSASVDCAGYKIYKKHGESGAYLLLKDISGASVFRYEDPDVTSGDTYSYHLRAYDDFGNLGEMSEIVSVTVDNDEEAPRITEIAPKNKRINGSINLDITAVDNRKVKSVILQYREESQADWIDLAKITYRDGAAWRFDTTRIPDGVYLISAEAVDSSGNTSIQRFTRRYEIDNTGIGKIVLKECKTISTSVSLAWQDVTEEDFAYFSVEQLIDGNYKEIARIKDKLGYNVTGLVPLTSYQFRVAGVDNLGNKGEYSDVVKCTTTADEISPAITKVAPGAEVRNKLELSVNATDNYELGKAVISFSTDGSEFTRLTSIQPSYAAKKYCYQYEFDVQEMAEGDLYIKYEVYDKAGNKNALAQNQEDIIVKYTIDRTAPSGVTNIRSNHDYGYGELIWDYPQNEGITEFVISRANAKNRVFMVIEDHWKNVNYFDVNVQPGETYLYKIAAVDRAGNRSEFSTEYEIALEEDKEAPVITGIAPDEGGELGLNARIHALAIDNLHTKKLVLEYRKASDTEGAWQPLAQEGDQDSQEIYAKVVWDNKDLENGEYVIRAIAEDAYGNVSEPFERTYRLNIVPPKVPKLKVTGSHCRIELEYEVADEDQVECYEIQRKAVGNANFERLLYTEEKIYLDTDIDVNSIYRYRVRAFYKNGATDWSDELVGYADDIDDTEPIAILPDSMMGIAGMEMEFDGMASRDNIRVASYQWDMGDGTVLNGARPVYAYAQPGNYTVSLIVKDAAGNCGTTTMEVSILEKSGYGSAILKVVGEGGEDIPYAYVHVVGEDGTVKNLQADSFGKIVLAGVVGKYKVSAFGTGYLPADIEVLFAEYQPMDYQIVLEKEELIVGKLTAKRLNLQEMKEAGVDFSDPENFNRVQFSIEITYRGCNNPIPLENIGPEPQEFKQDKRDITYQGIQRHSVSYSSPDYNASWDEVPIFCVQSVQEISWLKDMFKVELDILNAADAEYYIEDTKAVLNLPEGASLAKLNTSQSATVKLGTVHGQERKHAEWIVKGDTPGVKTLRADVTGTLMPFCAPVEAAFKTDIAVYGGTGIDIYVYPEEHVVQGEQTYIQFAIVNSSDVPVYNFSTTIGKYQATPVVTYVYDVDEKKVVEHKVNGMDVPEDYSYLASLFIHDGQKINIETLEPGGVITGTMIQNVQVGGVEPLQYYQLVERAVKIISGSETGVNIHTEVVPGHVYVNRISHKYERMEEERLKREEEEARREEERRLKQEEERLRAEEEERLREEAQAVGDPIDMNSGFFTDEVSLLSVTGASLLDISMRYSSGSSAFRGQLGFGWHHDYEKWLEQINGIIYYHSTPMDTFCFRKDETQNGCMAGRMEGTTLVLQGGEEHSYGRYVPMSAAMAGTVINRNTDGTYTLTYADKREYHFTADGDLSMVNDGSGITVSLTYYDDEMVIRDDLSGKRLHVLYDQYHRISKVKDDNGRETLLFYKGDDLCCVTNPEGYVTRYTYDIDHYILSEENEEGVYVTNTYDDAGRVTRQTNPEGDAMTLAYDKTDGKTLITTTYPGDIVNKIQLNESGRIEWTLDSNGAKTEYAYDEHGNCITETDALGNQIFKEYDSNGNVTKIVDQVKNTSLMEYDSSSRLKAVVNSDGKRAVYEYDDWGRPVYSKDMEGNEIYYAYNEHGQLIRQKQSDLGEISFIYENGLLKETVDYMGNHTKYEYDGAGNVIGETDALGNTTRTEYDKLGRVTATIDASGAKTCFTYDCNNRVTSIKDALGNVARYTYDRVGHPTKVIYPDGSFEQQEYDACGNLKTIIYADGSRMLYEYDGIGKKIKETWPDGRIYTAEYDLLGNRIAEKDVNGNVVRYEYYPNGNLQKVIHQDGTTELYTYNKEWKVATYTDITGSTTSYSYDSMNRLNAERDAAGNEIRYAYDALGRMTSLTDPNGNTTSYEYDKNSNCIKVIDALGDETYMEYDALNRMTCLYRLNKAGEKISVTYGYDALGRVSTCTDEMGHTRTMNYDARGNLLSVTDPDGHIASVTEYDSMGRVLKVTDDNMLETSCRYDKTGNLIESIMYLNGEAKRSTQYEYDICGRLIKVTDPMDGITKAGYDERGNIESITDPNGGETTYTYDNIGRLLTETNPVGSVYRYTYNAKGLLEQQKNARGQTTEYTYDEIGRVTSVKDDLGTVRYTYDGNGNILTVSDDNGTIRRDYDALNRVISYTDYNGKTVKYSYDELGNLVTLTYPGGEIVRYSYYKNGLLFSAEDPDGKITTYEYDSKGNLTKTVRPNGTIEQCTYNASGLLVEQVETAAAAGEEEPRELLHYRYTYDDYGNVKAIDGAKTLNTPEGISRLTGIKMTYDAANRLLTYNGEPVRYDADGNMIYGPVNGEMSTLTYDCRNRLTSAGGITYQYDPENVRISAESDSFKECYITESVSGSFSRVLSMTVYEKENGVIKGEGKETLYVYGSGLISEKTGDRILYHHYNNLGSTVLLTDAEGQTAAEYTYGAYGELLSGSASLTRFLYNGRCGVSTDANGLYYMRQRYYNVDIRRFINQDIISGDISNSQSLNRYCYVQGNPVKYTDPFGLSPEDGKNKASNFWHSLLGLVSIIPGPIGMIASAVDGAVYLAEGNYAMAAMCFLDAVIPAVGIAGKVLSTSCKYARVGKTIETGAKVANGIFNLARGMYNADKAVGNFCERHKDDLFTENFKWTKEDTLDAFSFGMAALTCVSSGKSLANDLDNFMAAGDDLATLGASVGCFVAGTLIKTSEGEKKIEDIQEGDLVLSYEASEGIFAYKEVLEVVAHEGVTELAHVTIDGETIDSTTNHPYFVVGYGFVEAGNLRTGDTILLANGENRKVDSVEIEFLDDPVTVYNFEVADWHTYFVGNTGVLVHNANIQACSDAAASAGGNGAGSKAQNNDYYQDDNERWHRSNGQFASNPEVGLPSTSDHYLNRPYLRKSTLDAIDANTRVRENGDIWDKISRGWVNPQNAEIGHTKGNEFWFWRNQAEAKGMTQAQFNDFMNNSEFYAWQDVHNNRSHLFEDKHK